MEVDRTPPVDSDPITDPLESKLRKTLYDMDAFINGLPKTLPPWRFFERAASLRYRAVVHVGRAWNRYRVSRIKLRRAIRGLRRALAAAKKQE